MHWDIFPHIPQSEPSAHSAGVDVVALGRPLDLSTRLLVHVNDPQRHSLAVRHIHEYRRLRRGLHGGLRGPRLRYQFLATPGVDAPPTTAAPRQQQLWKWVVVHFWWLWT